MQVCSLTDIGLSRDINQDYLYTSENAVGALENLFIIADGMGGHSGGEYASRCTIETIVETLTKSPLADETALLREAIHEANRLLPQIARDDPRLQGMGTTVVAATLKQGHLLVANVGDSRLYRIGEDIRQITCDHSLVQEMIRMGEIRPEEARSHPNKNIITRAVGAEADLEIDFFEEEVAPGDYILMCTDGLSNMLSDEEILQIIQTDIAFPNKVERLINAANNNGGIDNITAILIEV